jgi:ribosomal protein S18 acetylase RimI-like enzyme
MNNNSVDVRLIRSDEITAVPMELPEAFSQADRGAAHYSNCHVAVARRANRIVAAAPLAVAYAGYGRIWPPYLAADEPASTLEKLVRQVEWFFSQDEMQSLRHIRAFVDKDDSTAARRFESNGFDLHADILHLVCVNCESRHGCPTGKLSFRKVSSDDFPAFQEILQQTYTDSDDFPQLMRQFGEEDVGIRWQHGVGVGRSSTWLFAELGGYEAGCLVLDQEPEQQQTELVYMGLLPRHRGKGLGHELVRWGQWLAGQKNGGNRLTVSVDANNERALACYLKNDFVRYAETGLYVKEISGL